MKIKIKPGSAIISALMNSNPTTALSKTKLSSINSANFKSKRNLSFSTSFGIAGVDHCPENCRIEDTPIFSQVVTELLLPKWDKTLPYSRENVQNDTKCFLDMTFGSGGHSALLLDTAKVTNTAVNLVASDCDSSAFQAAKEIAVLYPTSSILPVRSRFSSLPLQLLDAGFAPRSFDGIIIDTGCSSAQWKDSTRGFCPAKEGILDLRMDEADSNCPTASEVLQHIDERSLYKMLKTYSELGTWAKYVASAIIEARYMFHQFQTTQELRDVLLQASRNICLAYRSGVDMRKRKCWTPNGNQDNSSDSMTISTDQENGNGVTEEEEITQVLMSQTVTALRMFVNDELNELNFALRRVAAEFLKPYTGTVITIIHTVPEQKVVRSVFYETDIPINLQSKTNLNIKDIENITRKSWNVLDGFDPQELSQTEKTLYPRINSALLFAASYQQ